MHFCLAVLSFWILFLNVNDEMECCHDPLPGNGYFSCLRFQFLAVLKLIILEINLPDQVFELIVDSTDGAPGCSVKYIRDILYILTQIVGSQYAPEPWFYIWTCCWQDESWSRMMMCIVVAGLQWCVRVRAGGRARLSGAHGGANEGGRAARRSSARAPRAPRQLRVR